jgi:hypothetical protein
MLQHGQRLQPWTSTVGWENISQAEAIGIGIALVRSCRNDAAPSTLKEKIKSIVFSGTPIHVVTGLMRHADSNVTLEHYAHIVGDAERIASEKFSQWIGQNITQLESDSELESTSSIKSA